MAQCAIVGINPHNSLLWPARYAFHIAGVLENAFAHQKPDGQQLE